MAAILYVYILWYVLILEAEILRMVDGVYDLSISSKKKIKKKKKKRFHNVSVGLQ